MTPTLYLGSVLAVLALALLVALTLHRRLLGILTELCGGADRARFWTIFSHVGLLLGALITALSFVPRTAAGHPFFEATRVVQRGMLGIVATISVLGIAIARFIPPSRSSGSDRISGSGRDER